MQFVGYKRVDNIHIGRHWLVWFHEQLLYVFSKWRYCRFLGHIRHTWFFDAYYAYAPSIWILYHSFCDIGHICRVSHFHVWLSCVLCKRLGYWRSFHNKGTFGLSSALVCRLCLSERFWYASWGWFDWCIHWDIGHTWTEACLEIKKPFLINLSHIWRNPPIITLKGKLNKINFPQKNTLPISFRLLKIVSLF